MLIWLIWLSAARESYLAIFQTVWIAVSLRCLRYGSYICWLVRLMFAHVKIRGREKGDSATLTACDARQWRENVTVEIPQSLFSLCTDGLGVHHLLINSKTIEANFSLSASLYSSAANFPRNMHWVGLISGRRMCLQHWKREREACFLRMETALKNLRKTIGVNPLL